MHLINSLRNRKHYKPLIWVFSLVCFFLFFMIGLKFLNDSDSLPGPDFVPYWSAGKLNISGGNPYEPLQLQAIQDQTGFIQDEVMIMWNPPWIISIFMIFSLLDLGSSRLVWFSRIQLDSATESSNNTSKGVLKLRHILGR